MSHCGPSSRREPELRRSRPIARLPVPHASAMTFLDTGDFRPLVVGLLPSGAFGHLAEPVAAGERAGLAGMPLAGSSPTRAEPPLPVLRPVPPGVRRRSRSSRAAGRHRGLLDEAAEATSAGRTPGNLPISRQPNQQRDQDDQSAPIKPVIRKALEFVRGLRHYSGHIPVSQKGAASESGGIFLSNQYG